MNKRTINLDQIKHSVYEAEAFFLKQEYKTKVYDTLLF